MDRKTISAFIIMALPLLVSCTGIETENSVICLKPIGISPMNPVLCKAAVDGTVFPADRTICVSASHTSRDGESANYFSGSVFTNDGEIWTSDRYWPSAGTLDFLAVSCGDLTVDNITYRDTVSRGVGFDVPDNSGTQADIMHSSVLAASPSASTDMIFRHSQAVIVFTAGSSVAFNPTTNTGITITGITLNDAFHAGHLDISARSDSDNGFCTWSGLYGENDVKLPGLLNYDVPSVPMDISSAGNHMGIGGYGIIVPEQDQTSFTIFYTLHNGFDGDGNISDNTLQSTYPCAGKWMEGKKYRYLLTFDVNGIVVNPSVEDWSVEEIQANLPETVSANYSVEGLSSVTLPDALLEEYSEVAVNWGDGHLEAFTNAVKAGKLCGNSLTLSHSYMQAYTGVVKLSVREGCMDFGTLESAEFHKFDVFDSERVKVREKTAGPSANCFIVNPSSDFSFSVGNADIFWGGNGYEDKPDYVIGDDGSWTAEILWTDFDPAGISLTKSSGAGNKDVCTVSFSGSPEGNAVIAIKKDDAIVWSFHLWVSAFDPEGTKITLAGEDWMSRNLGACSDLYEEAHTIHYQFGRKDPFPYDAVSGGTAITTVAAYDLAASTSDNNMPYAVNNPSVFILRYSDTSAGKVYSWWTKGAYNPDAGDTDLVWQDPTTASGGTREGQKSLFDPCPQGWRVPTADQLRALQEAGREWDATDKGSYCPSKTAENRIFFPCCGSHRSHNGTSYNRGVQGYIRSSTPASTVSYCYHLQSSSSKFGIVESGARADGFTVRCVREN